MSLTYRSLAIIINTYMTEEQRDCDVTVEVFDGQNTECFPAGLRVVGPDSDILDDGHPVIFVNQLKAVDEYFDSLSTYAEYVGLFRKE